MATFAEIQQLYIIYLGRPADPNGLDFWFSKNLPAIQIANAFGSTPEYQQRLADLGIAGAINQIYRNVFGRSPDSEGLQFWTQKVQTGQLSLETAGYVITNSATGSDVTTRDNKQSSATLYTQDVRTSTQSILAYDTSAGLNAGVTFLAGITTTPATEAEVQASVTTMTNDAGGGTGGLTFNQIAANAVLTNGANTNAAGTGAGFTPSANVLTNASDVIQVGVFSGATIQDSTVGDGDVLSLNSVGFANSLNVVAGIETISLNGAASMSAGQIAGVQTINFLQAGSLNNFSAAASANISVANSGVNTLSAAATFNSAVTVAFSAAANSGRFNLNGGTTALTLNFNSTVNSFTFNQTAEAAAQSLRIAGAGSAFTINLAGTASYTAAGGYISAGGNVLVNNTGFSAGIFGTTANVFSFATAGTNNTYQVNVGGATIAAVQNFGGVSGLDRINFATTAGAAAGAFAGFTLSANFDGGALALGFATAVTAGNALTGLFVAQDIAISASTASTVGTSDTLTLSFLSDSATSGLVFSAGAVTVSAVETISFNLYGSGGSFNIENAFSAAAASTFNLNTTAQGFASFLGSANLAGNSAFRSFGFSQADGGVTFSLSTAFVSAAATSYTFVAGSGSDVINFRNVQNSAGISAIFGNGQLSSLVASINRFDISDGGNDVIRLGFGTGFAQASGFVTAASAGNVFRARIAGFGIGDVLSFTQNSTAGGGLYVGTLTGNSLSQTTLGTTGLVGLFYDGTDTLVFFAGSAAVSANATYSQLALAAVLEGGNFSDAARWSMNAQGAMQLIA